jgi:phosphoribosyl-ATP pyrophosphohydrolase
MTLQELYDLITVRKQLPAEESYIARLHGKGLYKIAQKVGEEGVEVALATVSGDRKEIIYEAADLLFHLMIALEAQGVALDEVIQELSERAAKKEKKT